MRAGPEVTPPRLASWLVAQALPVDGREAVLGDLHERYVSRATEGGAARADRWYWQQVLSFMIRVPLWRAATRVGGRGRSDALVSGPAGACIASEIRFAARALRKRPGLSVVAIAVLALAVGANATVFSVVKAVLLDGLPFPEPDRLVMLWDVFPDRPPAGRQHPIALSHVREWSARTDLFEGVGAFETTSPALIHGEWPERIDGALVSVGLLDLLGAQPALGRLLGPDDALPGAEAVVVLSYGLWSSRFGGDPGIVGERIDLGGMQTRVVGVTSEGFWFYDPWSVFRSLSGRSAEAARLWQPIPDAGPYGGETDYPRYRVVARLRDGVSMSVAVAAAEAARPHLPATTAGEGASVRLMPLTEQVLDEARPRLLGLFGAVSLVLLIACINLISLLLVHIESRRSEFAVRAALGAGRGRIVRQLIIESTLLAVTGGLAGMLDGCAGSGGASGMGRSGYAVEELGRSDPVLSGSGRPVTAGCFPVRRRRAIRHAGDRVDRGTSCIRVVLAAAAGLVFANCGADPIGPGDQLTQTAESMHFTYSWSAGDERPDTAYQERHLAWFVAKLGVAPRAMLDYRKYRDTGHLKQLTGHDLGTGYAERSTYRFHTIWPKDNHEYVHALLMADVGVPPDFFNEGVAVAHHGASLSGPLDGPPLWNGTSAHAQVRALYLAGDLPALDDLIENRRFVDVPGVVSYAVAGSFVRYLLDEAGPSLFLQFMARCPDDASATASRDHFRAVYGDALDAWWDRWLAWLRADESD